MNEEIKYIPDNAYFAVKSKDLKELMAILQILEKKDRNQIFKLPYEHNTKQLYGNL